MLSCSRPLYPSQDAKWIHSMTPEGVADFFTSLCRSMWAEWPDWRRVRIGIQQDNEMRKCDMLWKTSVIQIVVFVWIRGLRHAHEHAWNQVHTNRQWTTWMISRLMHQHKVEPDRPPVDVFSLMFFGFSADIDVFLPACRSIQKLKCATREHVQIHNKTYWHHGGSHLFDCQKWIIRQDGTHQKSSHRSDWWIWFD